jgi:hypothetical protein
MYYTLCLHVGKCQPRIPHQGIGGLPDQIKLPSSPARAYQRHRGALFRAASQKLEAPVETDMHVVYDRTPNTKPPAANTFEPEELEKATSFTSQPSLRALIVSTALK